MDTLFAIGMLVGLMKGHAELPKAAVPQAEPRQMAQRQAETDKSPIRKKAEKPEKADWLLSY